MSWWFWHPDFPEEKTRGRRSRLNFRWALGNLRSKNHRKERSLRYEQRQFGKIQKPTKKINPQRSQQKVRQPPLSRRKRRRSQRNLSPPNSRKSNGIRPIRRRAGPRSTRKRVRIKRQQEEIKIPAATPGLRQNNVRSRSEHRIVIKPKSVKKTSSSFVINRHQIGRRSFGPIHLQKTVKQQIYKKISKHAQR